MVWGHYEFPFDWLLVLNDLYGRIFDNFGWCGIVIYHSFEAFVWRCYWDFAVLCFMSLSAFYWFENDELFCPFSLHNVLIGHFSRTLLRQWHTYSSIRHYNNNIFFYFLYVSINIKVDGNFYQVIKASHLIFHIELWYRFTKKAFFFILLIH